MSKATSEVYDTETFPNLFTYVGYNIHEDKWYEFILYDDIKYEGENSINDSKELYHHLCENIVFFGFNNLRFDGPILELILSKKGDITPQEIYQYGQDLINDDDTYLPQYKFKTKQIDLYTMWSFNTAQRRSSLKHLEFSMRMDEIRDLPKNHWEEITKSNVRKVVRYNKIDTENTLRIYDMSLDKLKLRKLVFEEYNKFSLLSKGDTSLGMYTFLYDLADEMGIPWYELKKMRSDYDEINLKDIIIHDRFIFLDDDFKKLVKRYENTTVYKDEEKGRINLKGAVTDTVEFNGIDFDYGLGGLHASHSNKRFVADDEYLIIDVDVASFYPNLAIKNKLHPKHLSEHFVKLYSKLYDTRKEYPKSTHFLMNLSYKLRLNAIFGYSNSPYSFLYDPAFTLGITVNGQLQLTMLAEQLSRCSRLIQVNTDGVTVMIHKSNLDKLNKVIEWWEDKTDLELEQDEYSEMNILDVNNYLAIYKDKDKVKRKGRLAIYEDYESGEEYHKNPSNLIIPKAVNEYLVNGTPIGDTIYNEENIHEFLSGFKGKSNFKFGIFTPDESGYVDADTLSTRMLRYYVSNEGSSLHKITDSLNTIAINKGQTISIAQKLRTNDAHTKTDLNREWYIQEAQEIVDMFEKVDNEKFLNYE